MKKKILLVASAVFMACSMNGQSNDVDPKRFRLGVIFSPDYCHRSLSSNSSHSWVEEIRNNEEVPGFGYTAGVSFQRHLTDAIMLESGLLYSVKGYQTKSGKLMWSEENNSYPEQSKTRFRYKYVDLPLRVKYRLNDGALKYFISAGVSMNLFIQKTTEVIVEFAGGEKDSDRSAVNVGYSRFNWAAVIGFGAEYDISSRLVVSAEPVYRQFINSIRVNSDIKEYPFSVGINVGVHYRFTKKKNVP